MAEFVEALGRKKYPVAGELLKYQLIVKVAGLRASGEGLGSKVFFVGGRNCSKARQLSRWRKLLVISALVSYTGKWLGGQVKQAISDNVLSVADGRRSGLV